MVALSAVAHAHGLPALADWLRGPWRGPAEDGRHPKRTGHVVGVVPHPTVPGGLQFTLRDGEGNWASPSAERVAEAIARRAPHFLRQGDTVYADTNVLHVASAYGPVEHVGFGDFRSDGPEGRVYFGRTESVKIPGQVGRAHALDGPPGAVEALVRAVESAPVRENPARSHWPISARPRRLSWNPGTDTAPDAAGAVQWRVVPTARGSVLALVPPAAASDERLEWTPAGWAGEGAGTPFPNEAAAKEHARRAPSPVERSAPGVPFWAPPRPGTGLRVNRGGGADDRALVELAAKLAPFAARAGFAALAAALRSPAPDPLGADVDAHGQTEAVRRRENVQALRILRAHQATRARGGNMQPLAPGERPTLLRYSGMGGIKVENLSPDERLLLRPDQQEYLRIQDEQVSARVRIASERGRAAKATELPQFGRVRGAFSGMIAEYFTAVEVAEGMTQWAMRIFEGTNGGTRPETILEPSAGVGRFLRAYERAGFGGSPRWDAVELDPDLADMLRLLYADQPGGRRIGDVRVHNLAFEQFYAANAAAKYDLVVANPPYAARGNTATADPAGQVWADAAHYFMWRTLTMLRPRGVMVHLTPAGVISGPDVQSRAIREALLLDGHLASAVMPPFEIFPQALLNLCITVWIKRPETLPRVLDADRAILDGHYFEQPENRQGIMGKPQGGHYRPEAISGEWSLARLNAQPIRVPPASVVLGASAPAMARSAPGDVTAALHGLARNEGYADDDPAAVAESLGSRVMRFRAAVETDPSEARAGQAELQADLREFAQSLGGRPRDLKVPAGKPSARLLAFFSAYDDKGGLTPALTALVDVPAGTYQGEKTARAACLHLAAQRGEAYLPDISRVLGRAVDPAELVLAPDVYFEPLLDDERGALVFSRAEEYFSGDAYAKVDWCEALANGRARLPLRLEPAQQSAVLAKCAAMSRKLVELVAPLPLGEVDIGIRSSWVHLDRKEGAMEWECPVLAEFFREAFNVDVSRVAVIHGMMIAEGAGAQTSAVEGAIAYFNRVESTYDDKGKKKNRQNGKDALQDRIAADRKLDAQYADFVRRHPDAAKIEDRYNRAYRGYIERVYSSEAVPLLRMPAEQRARIRPHAWAAVRRAAERRGGIMGLDVGLGKTASLLLTLALLRQRGLVRRAVIAVPNSVGPNWLEEVAMWLPDFRAVLVGATVKREKDGSIKTIPDNEARLLAKLQAFAAGQFDLAVVQQSTFERIRVDATRAREMMVQDFGVQREVALSKRKDQAAADKLKSLKEEIGKATTEKKKQAMQDQIDQLEVTPWIRRLNAQLDAAQRKGDKKEVKRLAKAAETFAKKQSITDRQRQTDQQRFDEWVDARVKPHRLALDGITWEEMNVDYLGVDEAHEYKNLYGPATRYGKKPKYMGAMAADKVVGKCWDLFVKAALVRASRDDTGVQLLTATPLKNSPLEAYNLLSYCTRSAFAARGLLTPEDYIDRYCRPDSEPVLTVMGGFREDLVVKQFTSLHELRGIFTTFVDVKVALPPDEYARAKDEGRNLANVVSLPLPVARPLTIHVPMDTNQEAYYDGYRRSASRAAEQAAATLCERSMRNLDADPSQLPRLRLPQLDDSAYPQRVRQLHAFALQFGDAWSRAFKEGAAHALDLPGLNGFGDLETVEKQPRAQAEIARLYGEMRTFLEDNEVRGALRMDDPALGNYGGKAAAPAASAADEDEGEGAGSARVVVVGDPTADEDESEESEEDDLFTVMDRMGKAALDLRLLGETVSRPPPKYRAVAEKVRELKGCGHIVFCDYNVTHAWIADALVQLAGVPRERIVSITGALSPGERQALARRLNGQWDRDRGEWIREPDIDIVIGGKAIEQGMNLQERSCAIHHLTFPWEPATIQQRNGRAVRQGNRLGEVFVFYYAAARSFDGYRLSLITGKRSWQRTLLESANRSTNNPGAELTGPCAMLRQLSSDEALAEEYCKCLENAAAKKAEAVRRERAAEDFAAFVAATTSAKRDGPKQAYYAEQAAALRAKLSAFDDAVFARKDLLDVAERIPLWWDLATGVPWIEGLPVCVANKSLMVERVVPHKAELVVRELGRWFTTTWSFGDASTRGENASATCDFDEATDRTRLAASYDLSVRTIRLVSPTMWAKHEEEGLAALNRQYATLPWMDPDGTLALRKPSDRAPAWRLLLPWTREDADAYLGAVRALPKHQRVGSRELYSNTYTHYFGRVYPAELRDEV